MTFEPHIWPHFCSKHPMNDYLIFWTLHYVCNNGEFDFKYGLYGCNVRSMWKISHFGWFFKKCCGLWTLYMTPYPTQAPINAEYFIFWTLHYACNNDKFDSIYGWYGCNFQNKWKIAHFRWFLWIFWTFGVQILPHILFSHPINDYLNFGTLQLCM